MAQLSSKIKIYLDRKVDFQKDVILQNDSNGQGDYIKSWNVAEEQPTEAQLNALESQADELETANQVIANRKKEYPSIEECVHAILDDTLDELQILRQAVKEKYPK